MNTKRPLPAADAANKRRLHSVPKDRRSGKERQGMAANPDVHVQKALKREDVPVPLNLPKGVMDKFYEALDLILSLDTTGTGDALAISILCATWAELNHVNYLIERTGYLIETETQHGSIVKANPLLSERARLRATLRPLLVEFGLTPSARRMVLKRDPKKPENDEEEAWKKFLQPAT